MLSFSSHNTLLSLFNAQFIAYQRDLTLLLLNATYDLQ